MEILVPHQIRRKEIPFHELSDAKKLFAKLKTKPDLATPLAAKALPARMSLLKVYATTAHGARRLLFFYRQPPPAPPAEAPAAPSQERWVLLFYRDKHDAVGKNMSPTNPNFENQLTRNLELALADLATSTLAERRYEIY